MKAFQAAFVDLLLQYEVLRFGDFTLKSGRRSPYFVNAGQLRTGDAIRRLGEAYAAQIDDLGLACDLVFGPSYKGVPLAVATAVALAARGRDVGYAFDRKEAKDHGEGGIFVGTTPEDGMHVVIVDDVITSGRSIREAVACVRAAAAVTVSGVVVAVDRQERGRSSRTTATELREELSVPIAPVVTIREVVGHLHGKTVGDVVLVDDVRRAAIESHLAEHGGTEHGS